MSAGAHGGQKRALDPLELELQAVVRQELDAESQTSVLCKSSVCCKPLSRLSNPRYYSRVNFCLKV